MRIRKTDINIFVSRELSMFLLQCKKTDQGYKYLFYSNYSSSIIFLRSLFKNLNMHVVSLAKMIELFLIGANINF